MTRIWLLLLLLALLLCACARPVELRPGFEELSGYFVQSMRWQDFQGASKFVAEAQREAFLEQFPRNKDLHMVDVRFVRIALDEEGGEAETVLFVEYYLLPSPVVREWRWTQQWRRLAAEVSNGARWQIQTPPPAFP